MIKQLTALLMLSFMLFSVPACSSDDTVEDYSVADVSSYIKFGTYEQDKKAANGSGGDHYGLGLPIAKAIVTAHKVRINV